MENQHIKFPRSDSAYSWLFKWRSEPYTFRELLCGQTNQNKTKDENMKKNSCPDGIYTDQQSKVLGNLEVPHGIKWFRTLPDWCQVGIYALVILPTLGAIFFYFLNRSH